MRPPRRSLLLFAAAPWLIALSFGAAKSSAANILVYDNDTLNNFASTAALNLDPTRVVADSGSFNTLLTSQSWDVVLIDCPSNTPSGGWDPTINYVNSGGRAAMSFWDWDNDDGYGDPQLLPAFGLSGASSFSLSGRTLTDAGTTSVFAGVTMPNSDWNEHWADDGDGFTFSMMSGTVGMANLSGVPGPVMAQGNGGRTIAAFLIDEAGATWINDGSGVILWENMARAVSIPEPSSAVLLALGSLSAILAVRRTRRSLG